MVFLPIPKNQPRREHFYSIWWTFLPHSNMAVTKIEYELNVNRIYRKRTNKPRHSFSLRVTRVIQTAAFEWQLHCVCELTSGICELEKITSTKAQRHVHVISICHRLPILGSVVNLDLLFFIPCRLFLNYKINVTVNISFTVKWYTEGYVFLPLPPVRISESYNLQKFTQ